MGAEELDERPRVRLYSRRQARRLFAGFANVRTTVVHFGVDVRRLDRLPESIQNGIARVFGWYVVVEGDAPPG
jgi:hypothetical protein